jgi:hypothetical protein
MVKMRKIPDASVGSRQCELTLVVGLEVGFLVPLTFPDAVDIIVRAIRLSARKQGFILILCVAVREKVSTNWLSDKDKSR